MVISIPLSKKGTHAGQFFAIVDEADKDLLAYSWSVRISARTQYARRTLSWKPYRDIALHQVIALRMFPEIPKGMQIDHVDGDGLNNTRENLRLATINQQRANIRKHRDNQTGFKGVTLHKPSGLYAARIQHQKKLNHLGYFDTPELAHKAYLAKAKELFGEFANGGNAE